MPCHESLKSGDAWPTWNFLNQLQNSPTISSDSQVILWRAMLALSVHSQDVRPQDQLLRGGRMSVFLTFSLAILLRQVRYSLREHTCTHMWAHILAPLLRKTCYLLVSKLLAYIYSWFSSTDHFLNKLFEPKLIWRKSNRKWDVSLVQERWEHGRGESEKLMSS